MINIIKKIYYSIINQIQPINSFHILKEFMNPCHRKKKKEENRKLLFILWLLRASIFIMTNNVNSQF